MRNNTEPYEQKDSLQRFTTKELVEELETREGVETKVAEPYEDMSVSVNGPAVVLIVID